MVDRGKISMLRKTAVEILLDKLEEWGVERIYGIPGDSINTIMDEIRKRRQARFIQVRHEEAGALMAAAEAKLTGRLAVCVGTSGPGAIHLLNGLYEAKMDRAPVLAITGQVETDMIGTDYFQEVNLEKLFDDVAVFNTTIMSPDHVAILTSHACRESIVKRGVAHLSFPLNIPRMRASEDFPESNTSYTPCHPVPCMPELEGAVKLLNDGESIIVLVGRGAHGARQQVIELAEKLAAPIVNTLPGKGVIPDEHPLSLGGLGLLGTRPAQDAMEKADTLLMVGTSYPYTWFLPKGAKTIQIDIEADKIGKRYPVDVGLIGESRLTIEALSGMIKHHDDGSFLKNSQKSMSDWRRKMEEQSKSKDVPIRPQGLAKAIEQAVEDDAVISVDTGNVTVWMARNFNAKNHTFLFSSWLGTMGSGLPGAVASKFIYPDRQAVAAVGDGGLAMTMADFCTAVKYNLPILVAVFNNQKLGMIKFEQEVMGHPEFGTELHNPDFALYAKACGGFGVHVEEPEQIVPSLKEALNSGKPSIVDVSVNPDERPMPPKVKVEQVARYTMALFREKFEL